jgi:hypothetical protein
MSIYRNLIVCSAVVLAGLLATSLAKPPTTKPVDPPATAPADKDNDKTKAKAARRFIDRGQYVEDTTTGLLWQKDGDDSGKLNFYQAADYAKGLKLGKLKGWRVPTAAECATIFPANEPPFVDTHYNPAPYGKAEAGGSRDWASYWTSDLDAGEDYAFVYQWYGRGGANNCYASKNFDYVRCVHDPVKK